MPKLLDGQTGIADETCHGVGIDRVVPRDREHADPVGHDDILALTNYVETGFLEGSNCVEMVDARELRHA